MTNTIYGVDPNKPITPIKIRDAIRECFYIAHHKNIELQGDKETKKNYCDHIIKKIFNDVGGDFNNPTKEEIKKVVIELKAYSKNFRDPLIIKKHIGEIMKLVNKL